MKMEPWLGKYEQETSFRHAKIGQDSGQRYEGRDQPSRLRSDSARAGKNHQEVTSIREEETKYHDKVITLCQAMPEVTKSSIPRARAVGPCSRS